MTRLAPATIGDESPAGAGTFQLTFFSGPNSTGGFWASATPDPFGPRNRGHTSAGSAARPTAANRTTDANAVNFIMVCSLGYSAAGPLFQRRFSRGHTDQESTTPTGSPVRP